MKTFLLLLLLTIAGTAQTRPLASQIKWEQTDESFFRQCLFMTDGSYAHAYAYFPNQRHRTPSSSKTPTTAIKLSQVRNYGVTTDGTVLMVANWTQTWKMTATNTTAVGDVQVRYGMLQPNFNLIGMEYEDVKIDIGGWGMTKDGNYNNRPPLVTAHLEGGKFTVLQTFTVFHNTCELWNTGTFTDIRPNP